MVRYFSLIVAFSLLLVGCGSVPVTGRKQLNLVSDQEVLTLSLQQYSDFIKSAPISTDKANTALVQKVGRNIANAVETYLRNNGYANELSAYAWEFNLVKSTEVNAFCMPGGKIVVYEGILPYTQNETGLAVVLGHEVAHAVAKHANERMSQQMLTGYGTAAVGTALGGASAGVKQATAAALGLGSQYGILLPFSRKQELEADELGLIFMAMAGYDPNQAAAFWIRMSQQGSSMPEFMSTHPSDNTRIQQIQKDLPKALKYYKGGNSTTNINSAKTSEKWSF
jgi:predicted Zn-dependent protease